MSRQLAVRNPNTQLANLSRAVSTLANVASTLKKSAPPQAPAPRAARQPRQRVSAPRRAFKPEMEQMLAHEVCSVTNPFCDEAKGSKWPDASAVFTLPVPVRQRIPLTTDANGRVGVIFTSCYGTDGIIPGTFPAANSTFEAAAKASWSDYVPNFSGSQSYRLVTGGVRFTSTVAPMVASGVVNLIELPPTNDTLVDYDAMDLSIQNKPTYTTVPLKDPRSVYGIMRPGGPESRIFTIPWNAGNATTDTQDWSSICIFVEGGPASTQVGFVDVFMNFELTFDPNTNTAYLATPASHMNTPVIKAATELYRTDNSHVGNDAGVDQSFLSKAWGIVKSGGSFVYENAGAIANIGAAGVHAYTGNYPAAGSHLMGAAQSGGRQRFTRGSESWGGSAPNMD